ncbi:MAG TPA: LysR family transcriptional regulator [Chitinophagaceae bacterium]
MDIRHVKMIKEVATHGNLTKAAEHLFLSQSALSHQLKEIESFFQTQIFIRQKNRMVLTRAGEIILSASEKILDEIDATQRKIRQLTNKDAGEIRLSTQCYTAYHWLSSFIKDFKKQYPSVEVSINADATHRSEEFLLQNKIDIGITSSNLNKKLNYTPLFKDEHVAIVSPDHPWAKLEFVEPVQFLAENFIMYDIPEEESIMYQFLFSNGSPKKLYKMALTEAMIELVKAGIGVAALASWAVKPHIDSGELVSVRITEKGIRRTWYAATLKNKQVPVYTTLFIRSLARHLKMSNTPTSSETKAVA